MDHASFPEISGVVNFLVLAIALIVLLKTPLRSFLSDRSVTIRKNVEESEKLHQEAVTLLRGYEDKLNKLDSEIKTMIADAKAQGEAEKKKILERAEKMSEQIIENAKNMVTREMAKQKDTLQKELMAKVIAEALESLKEKTSEKDHQVFTTRFIEQMEKQNGDVN